MSDEGEVVAKLTPPVSIDYPDDKFDKVEVVFENGGIVFKERVLNDIELYKGDTIRQYSLEQKYKDAENKRFAIFTKSDSSDGNYDDWVLEVRDDFVIKKEVLDKLFEICE